MPYTARTHHGYIAYAVAGLGALASLPFAAALAAGNGGEGALQVITVTATKLYAAKVIDVPASIQAISGSVLQRDGASGIMSIAGKVPGLSIQDLGPGDKKYVIRGINSTGASTTGVYYGEAVINQGNGDDGGGFEPDIRLYDLNRVEVLRGPQGTLYGASSMSGTIRFIPNAPVMNRVEGYVSLEDSSTDHGSGNYNANGALNLPIFDNLLSLRVVGWKLYQSGYVNQIRVGSGVTAVANGVTLPVQPLGFIRGVNNDIVGGGRAMLRYQPTRNLTVDLNYTGQTETSNGSSRWTPPGIAAFSGGPIAPVQGCDLCNTDVTQSPWSDNIKVFGLTARWQTRIGLLTATTNQFNRNTGFTFDSTPILVSFGVNVPAETFEPRNRRSNSSEVRFASDFASPVNFVVGVFHQRTLQDLNVEVISTDALGLPTGSFSAANSADALNFPGVGDTFFGRSDHRDDSQWAGFGEATWKITDRWTAVGGLRYFTEQLNGFQVQTHPFGGFPPGTPNGVAIYDPTETFNKVTWKGNLSYKFNKAALLYGTVATGFRSGGLNAVSEPFEPIPPAFSPDTLTNYELGLKGELFSGLFDYQVDAYLIHWNNIQEQLTTADAAFVYQGNAGQAEVKGFEFDLTARPIPFMTSTLTGSWQDAKLTDGASPAQKTLNPTLGVTGEKIPNVPEYQFNLNLDYTRPVSADWRASFGANVAYRGSIDAYFASNPFNLVLPSYTLVGLRAGAIHGPWTFTAFAHNLTDERAQVSAINSSQDPHALLTVQPRTIGLRVTRKF